MKLTEFGKQLRKVRIDNDERMIDMASKLKVSAAFLSAIETGRKPVPPRLIDALQRIYRLSNTETTALMESVAKGRNEFTFQLNISAPLSHRMAAVALARRFPSMTDDEIERVKQALELEKASDCDD